MPSDAINIYILTDQTVFEIYQFYIMISCTLKEKISTYCLHFILNFVLYFILKKMSICTSTFLNNVCKAVACQWIIFIGFVVSQRKILKSKSRHSSLDFSYDHFHKEEQARPVCSVCHKSFFDARTLRRHMEIHSSVRPHYKCQFCARTFLWKNHLQSHVRSVHKLGSRLT